MSKAEGCKRDWRQVKRWASGPEGEQGGGRVRQRASCGGLAGKGQARLRAGEADGRLG